VIEDVVGANRISRAKRIEHCITVVLLLTATSGSFACSFKKRTDGELLADTKTVFRAKVIEVKLVTLTYPNHPLQSEEIVEARYEVKEVLKGKPPTSGIVRDYPFASGNCSLGLFPGVEYVLFLGNGDFVTMPTGSFHYITIKDAVTPRLSALRKQVTTTK
jgi:hypothetical protein